MFITNNQIEQFLSDGFIRLQSFLTKEEVDQIETELNEFIRAEAQKLSGKQINYIDGKINSIHQLAQDNNFFWKLLRQEKIVDAVGELLADKPIPMHAELFAKPPKVGLSSPMHQDNAYWCLNPAIGMTVWIALDICDETNGGLAYFRGSHRLGPVKHKASGAPGSSQTILDSGILENLSGDYTVVRLNPGDVLMHNVEVIHGSAANVSDRSRRGVTLQYYGSKACVDPLLKLAYEQSLKEQLEARTKDKSSV